MSSTEYQFDLFLSHASEDAAWCERLALRLRGEGVRVWFDKWELLGGDRLTERVNQGIETSRQMAVVWTPRYFAQDKNWTLAEQASRHQADLRGKERLLLPVLREDCEIPALLADLLRIDFRDENRFEQAFNELFNALCLPTSIRRSSAPVDKSGDDDERPNQQSIEPPIVNTSTTSAAEALGPLLDPVLLVLSVVFVGMLSFGVLLVCKGALVLGTACVIAGFAGSLGFLFVYAARRIRGAPSSGQEFALIRNTTTLLNDHARSAAERRIPFSK
jgi:TIR domain